MVYIEGLSHSEIAGSKVAGHLPDAYRRQTASFIAFFSLGIHRTPLSRISLEILGTACLIFLQLFNLQKDPATPCLEVWTFLCLYNLSTFRWKVPVSHPGRPAHPDVDRGMHEPVWNN